MKKTNKLIAEFMGAEWHKDFFKDVCIISPSNISYKFHNSWDWLMPVLEKVEQVNEGIPPQLIHLSLFSTINEVYEAVVEFIKNQNK
tara:strand:- start:988 stop:1248 length:261 start_codon:yes stop_codon:yes gene_type:complete